MATRDDHPTEPHRQRYVHELLRLYIATPGVAGRVRRADRQLAQALYDRDVPLHAVANALIVAAARRIRHNAFSTPLPPIQSLAYFKGPIREMLDRPPGYREIEQLRQTLRDHYRAAPGPWPG
jgi:hypothetical protein